MQEVDPGRILFKTTVVLQSEHEWTRHPEINHGKSGCLMICWVAFIFRSCGSVEFRDVCPTSPWGLLRFGLSRIQENNDWIRSNNLSDACHETDGLDGSCVLHHSAMVNRSSCKNGLWKVMKSSTISNII